MEQIDKDICGNEPKCENINPFDAPEADSEEIYMSEEECESNNTNPKYGVALDEVASYKPTPAFTLK